MNKLFDAIHTHRRNLQIFLLMATWNLLGVATSTPLTVIVANFTIMILAYRLSPEVDLNDSKSKGA